MKIGFLGKLPKEKLQKVVLVCIVTLIAVAGVVEFYVLKNWRALTETRAGIVKLKDQIGEAERKARNAQQDVAYRANVKSFVATQQAAMITGDPYAWVVREISLLAEQHPVRVLALHPGGKAESDGKSAGQIYKMSIDFAGTYDQIGEFVRDLENKFTTAEVRSLSLSGIADDKGRHGGTLEIALRMQPPEPAKQAEGKKT